MKDDEKIDLIMLWLIIFPAGVLVLCVLAAMIKITLDFLFH